MKCSAAYSRIQCHRKWWPLAYKEIITDTLLGYSRNARRERSRAVGPVLPSLSFQHLIVMFRNHREVPGNFNSA